MVQMAAVSGTGDSLERVVGQRKVLLLVLLFPSLLNAPKSSLFLAEEEEKAVLFCLGYWWGCLGWKCKYLEKSFVLGILILSGSFLSGFSIWLQQIFQVHGSFFNVWALQNVLSGSIVSGLIAPLLCSLSLNTFFRGKG